MGNGITKLGNAIRAARIKKGYTQEFFAEKLDITPGHLQHMESGRRNPSVPMLFQIMELLDMPVDPLVFGAESPVISVDGLTEQQITLIQQFLETIRKKPES